MTSGKLVGLLAPVLVALILGFGGFLYARGESNFRLAASTSERLARQETGNMDMLRRLENIEKKLDALLLEARR